MAANVKPLLLNLGCGTYKRPDYVNVDAFETCKPDVLHDLNVTPYPWADSSVDGIVMTHVLEHLTNWWEAVRECARILKPGGTLQIHVPDESSATALTYRDHVKVFGLCSFHGIEGRGSGSNAWAMTVEGSVPLQMEHYFQVPYAEYQWMIRFPRILRFCARHLRNFIWEQQFHFRKV